MIDWLLERLAQQPTARFWRAELEAHFPEVFVAAVSDGLLRPVRVDLSGTYYDHRTCRVYALVERDGLVEGWCEDEPEAAPFSLGPLDLGCFEVDLAALAHRFQAANGLVGAPQPLHPRLLLLGTKEDPLGQIAVVLAFCPTSNAAMDLLRGLPTHFAQPPERLVAITPNCTLGEADVQVLAALGVFAVPLGHPDPFLVTTWPIVVSTPVKLGASPTDAVPQQTSVERYALRRTGDAWTITYEGRSISVRNVVGVAYLAYLVRHPFHNFHVLDLVQMVEGGETTDVVDQREATDLDLSFDGSNGEAELIDVDARGDYRRRLAELEAKALAGVLSADEQEEQRWLHRMLRTATGLGGRPRKTASRAERERIRVTKAIRRAIDRIKAIDPGLGQHLENAITTATTCCYSPDRPLRWTT